MISDITEHARELIQEKDALLDQVKAQHTQLQRAKSMCKFGMPYVQKTLGKDWREYLGDDADE